MNHYFTLIIFATIILFILLLLDWISFMLFALVYLLLAVAMLVVGILERKKR